jgi:hypothetical protein
MMWAILVQFQFGHAQPKRRGWPLGTETYLHGTTGTNGLNERTYTDGFRDGHLDLDGSLLPIEERTSHPARSLSHWSNSVS